MLSVQTDFLTEENLASYYVNTPDPNLTCGSVGQRMIVSWSIGKNCQDLYIHMQIRYRNHEENVIDLYNLAPRGIYTYSLLNEEYFEKNGILAFRIQLKRGETVVEEWVHQLWVDLITLDTNTKN